MPEKETLISVTGRTLRKDLVDIGKILLLVFAFTIAISLVLSVQIPAMGEMCLAFVFIYSTIAIGTALARKIVDRDICRGCLYRDLS